MDDGRQWQYYGAIHFEARGNVLYIEGENSILRDPSKADGVAAICVRAKGSEIDSSVIFHGTGSMTIDGVNTTGYSTFYAAAIGGRQGERTGDMTFNGGTWTVRNNGFGACIGSGTSSGSQYDSTLYTSKIEINGEPLSWKPATPAQRSAPVSAPAAALQRSGSCHQWWQHPGYLLVWRRRHWLRHVWP